MSFSPPTIHCLKFLLPFAGAKWFQPYASHWIILWTLIAYYILIHSRRENVESVPVHVLRENAIENVKTQQPYQGDPLEGENTLSLQSGEIEVPSK